MKLSPTILLGLLCATVASSCNTIQKADLTRYVSAQGFVLTTDEPPPNTRPVGILQTQEDGFYLLGFIPVVPVSLQNALDRLVKQAKLVDADGIAALKYEVSPADAFKFSVFPVPDWTATISVSGTVFRRMSAPEVTSMPPDSKNFR